MGATIRDVAAKAGVSFQLVSAVLGKRSYARVAPKTRERIEQAAEELGYMPNISARILQGGPSRMLGVLVDSRAPETTFALIAELEQSAEANGYRILIAEAHDSPQRLFESYRALKQNGVDGVISLSVDYPGNNEFLAEKFRNEKRLVFLSEVPFSGHPTIRHNVTIAIATAVKHLLDNNYKNPALLVHIKQPEIGLSIKSRIAGFRQELPNSVVIPLPEFFDDISRLTPHVAELVDNIHSMKVDAIIAQNDYVAAVVMRELVKRNYRIPEDFGIIGYDNRPICECLSVRLSSIAYNDKQAADKAMEIMLAAINNEVLPSEITLSPELIIRESSNRK